MPSERPTRDEIRQVAGEVIDKHLRFISLDQRIRQIAAEVQNLSQGLAWYGEQRDAPSKRP